jgi:hypothetical protein
MSKALIVMALLTGASVALSCSSGSGGSSGGAPGPAVQILMPTPGEQFTTTDQIPVVGSAVDPIDGPITDPRQLAWSLQSDTIVDPVGEGTSDVIGPIDAGGTYTLKLTATDSRGEQGETQVEIVVH